MMEDKENKESNGECPECKPGVCPECGFKHGGMCGMMHGHMGCHCCHHGHRFIRIVIGFLILVFVFWAGVKLGEIKSLMYNGGGTYSFPGGYMMWRGGQSGLENGCWGPAMVNLYGKNYEAPTSSAK